MSITHPPSRHVDPTGSPVPPRRAGSGLSRLRGAAVLGGLGQALAGSAGALLAARLAGDAWSGVPQTALVVGAGTGAALMARATPRLGRARALAAGAAVAVAGALTVAASSQAGSLVLLVAGCVLVGSGNASLMLSRYAAAELVAPSYRARAMGSVLGATTLGAVAGPNLLAAANWVGGRVGLADLTGPYLLAAAAFVVATLVLGMGTTGTAPTPSPSPESTPADEADGAEAGSRWSRRARVGLVVLAVANLVMVSVMTMAPVHLHHAGAGLSTVGLVVSLHIAGMFAPSPASGWLTDRWGAEHTAMAAGVVLAASCAAAATLPTGHQVTWGVGFTVAMFGLGIGWNLALVSGSELLTAGIAERQRPRREGVGEVSMAVAAAGGGVGGGVLMAASGYPWLAGAGLLLSLLIPALLLGTRRREKATPTLPRPTSDNTLTADAGGVP
jgi:MFS family permease